MTAQRMPQIKPKQCIKALEKAGFIKRRQSGSHITLKHPNIASIITVPIHSKDLKRGLLMAIIRQANLSQEDFIRLLKK